MTWIEEYSKVEPTYNNLLRIAKKYGARFMISDVGMNYHDRLMEKYYQGIHFSTEKMLILLTLSSYVTDMDRTSVDLIHELVYELKTRDVNAKEQCIVDYLIDECFKFGYLKRNPNFDEATRVEIQKLVRNTFGF